MAPPAKRLDGKVAVVTGSGSGLGRSICVLFADHGAKLVCADLLPTEDPARSGREGVTSTHELVQQNGGEAIYVKCDVTRSADVEALIAEAVAQYGRVDIMINNAGICAEASAPSPVHECSEDIFDKLIAVNTKGVFLGCKYAVAQMMKQEPHPSGDRGWVVNTASVMAVVGMAHCPAYSASKHAVVGLTKSMALDYGPHRIHCNAVGPGYTETPMMTAAKALITPEVKEQMSALHPFKGLGEPEDIARATLFLASEDASWVNGHCLIVDGGFTAR